MMEEITTRDKSKENNHTSENKIKIHNGKIKHFFVFQFHNQEQKE